MDIITGDQVRKPLKFTVFWIMTPCSLVDMFNRMYTVLQSDTTLIM